MRFGIVLAVLSLVVVGPAFAQAPAKPAELPKPAVPAKPVDVPKPEMSKPEGPKLEELDLLRIGKLWAERQALSAAYDKAVAQQELLKLHMGKLESDFKDKNAALTAAVRDAATKAKLKPEDGWKPNLDQGVWTKD